MESAALEAVAGCPVAEPRPGSAEPPRAARRTLRSRRSRARAVLRGHFDMLCCCWSPRCSGAREAWMSNSAARPREDDSCLVSPIAPASAVAPCLVMPATSCPARVRDEDQLAVGALLPAVHGRFTSSRSYRSPDRSSSYRVALIIWRAALPLRRRVSTACGRGSSTVSSLRNGDAQLVPAQRLGRAGQCHVHTFNLPP